MSPGDVSFNMLQSIDSLEPEEAALSFSHSRALVSQTIPSERYS
jgi:hypothetical protein